MLACEPGGAVNLHRVLHKPRQHDNSIPMLHMLAANGEGVALVVKVHVVKVKT